MREWQKRLRIYLAGKAMDVRQSSGTSLHRPALPHPPKQHAGITGVKQTNKEKE